MLVVVGRCWWVLVGVGGCWWVLVGVGGCWWVLVDENIEQEMGEKEILLNTLLVSK